METLNNSWSNIGIDPTLKLTEKILYKLDAVRLFHIQLVSGKTSTTTKSENKNNADNYVFFSDAN